MFNININSVGIVSRWGFFSAIISKPSREESSCPHFLQNSSVEGYFSLQDSQNLDKSISGPMRFNTSRFFKQCGQLSNSEGCFKSHLSQLEKSFAIAILFLWNLNPIMYTKMPRITKTPIDAMSNINIPGSINEKSTLAPFQDRCSKTASK